MKDYEHVVVWLDYFNKNLKRSKGRRLRLDRCVFDPTIKELADAARAAGYEVAEPNESARFPKRAFVRSGYVALSKKGTRKAEILDKIAQALVLRRSKKSR